MSKPSNGTKIAGKQIKSPDEDESRSEATSAKLLATHFFAASPLVDFMRPFYGKVQLTGLAKGLSDQCDAVNQGDLNRPEAILLTQAFTLDAIFINLSSRAAQNSNHLEHLDRLLRLALKAQSQCRATLETLANIKNPPLVLARQANITSGPQQVNNGLAASPVREIDNQPNKLLESEHAQRLDTRTACSAGCLDPELATLGKVHRTEDA
jgi:hypothetical protein